MQLPDSHDRLHRAERDVALAVAALERGRRQRLALSELRRRDAAVTAALDVAVGVARTGGATLHQQLHRLRTQRELHVLAGGAAAGVRVPNCVRASSRAASGPQVAGMDFEPASASGPPDTRTYGLDLIAALDGVPRPDLPGSAGPAVVHQFWVRHVPVPSLDMAG